MRIGLFSFHSFIRPGGVKRHILGLRKEFKRRGIYSKIIAPRRSFKENYGKDVILLGTSFPISFSGSQSDFCINFNPLAIERILKKEKFDVLHFHNFGFPSAWQILEKSEALNILTFHANIEKSEFLKNFPIFLYLFKRMVQWKIDGIIGVAPLNLEPFKRYSGPKTVIPNGVDLEKFNPRCPKIEKPSPFGPKGWVNILFLGRIEERKGLIYLLKAYKILTKNSTPNFAPHQNWWGGLRLIIVGEGPLKNDLENWVKINKLKNVFFEGKVPEEKVASYYKSCDIYCSPAIFGESFGLVLLEAMACGTPVAAFANTGYKQFLKGKKGGRFLAKNRNYRDLAEKLEILIKDKKLREEMGEWGIAEAKKYSWPRITDQVLDFYQLCLKEKRKRERREGFSLEKSFDKILKKISNEDILDWLKKLKIV